MYRYMYMYVYILIESTGTVIVFVLQPISSHDSLLALASTIAVCT